VIAVLRYNIKSIDPSPGKVEVDLWNNALADYSLGIMEPGERQWAGSITIEYK